MGSIQVEQGLDQYRLSRRGAYNCLNRDVWGPREKLVQNPWSPSNPDGMILLRLAENSLLHSDIAKFIQQQVAVLPSDHLTYSTGPRGSLRLRRAVATYLMEEFHALNPVTSDDIFITPGLTSAVDSISWAICNEKEGILVPKPFYNGFQIDITHRSDAQIVGVTYDDIEGYSSLDDLFLPGINREALEMALRESKRCGIEARGLLISQPHNPLGRCYPPETLKEFISFCNRHKLHFISDEIYAKSVFENPAVRGTTTFTSSLALRWDELIDPNLFHVLYGASKDFCANGLRLGAVFTKNKGILGAMSSISSFSWGPHVLQDVWAAMLEDKEWTRRMVQKNNKLMAENYAIITAFLRHHDIEYYEMNAGLFLWVDLRGFLFPKSERCEADYGVLRVASPAADIYKNRELRIAEICTENGVMISPGAIYAPAEYGWFRITFTADRDALEEGLRRVQKSLEALEGSAWN